MRLALTACLMLAVPAWGHGDLHERIEALTARIAKSPQQGALYLERAGLHAAHEEYEAAAADYERAESLNADPLMVWLGRGKVQLATGRPKDARDTLDQLLAREPRHVEALVTRARVRVALKDSDGAAADFTAAIAASARPEPEYFLERAAALASTVPPDWEAAIRGLDEGLAKLGSGIATLQLAAIDLETKAGRLDAAIARLDRARTGAARQESWLVLRGDLFAKAGRTREATEAYQAALAAIAKLPPRTRQTRAVVVLETRARQALASSAANRQSPAAADPDAPDQR